MTGVKTHCCSVESQVPTTQLMSCSRQFLGLPAHAPSAQKNGATWQKSALSLPLHGVPSGDAEKLVVLWVGTH